jgi:hypothetical protein
VREVGGKQIIAKKDLTRFLKKGNLTQIPTVLSGGMLYVTDGSPVEPGTVLGAVIPLASLLVYTFVRP